MSGYDYLAVLVAWVVLLLPKLWSAFLTAEGKGRRWAMFVALNVHLVSVGMLVALMLLRFRGVEW